jgi:hypothetical protein
MSDSKEEKLKSIRSCTTMIKYNDSVLSGYTFGNFSQNFYKDGYFGHYVLGLIYSFLETETVDINTIEELISDVSMFPDSKETEALLGQLRTRLDTLPKDFDSDNQPINCEGTSDSGALSGIIDSTIELNGEIKQSLNKVLEKTIDNILDKRNRQKDRCCEITRMRDYLTKEYPEYVGKSGVRCISDIEDIVDIILNDVNRFKVQINTCIATGRDIPERNKLLFKFYKKLVNKLREDVYCLYTSQVESSPTLHDCVDRLDSIIPWFREPI